MQEVASSTVYASTGLPTQRDVAPSAAGSPPAVEDEEDDEEGTPTLVAVQPTRMVALRMVVALTTPRPSDRQGIHGTVAASRRRRRSPVRMTPACAQLTGTVPLVDFQISPRRQTPPLVGTLLRVGSRGLRGALLASALAATAGCASLLGIDDVGYGERPPSESDGAAVEGGGGDAIADAGDGCANGGCCVCPADASCVGSCVTPVFVGPNGPTDLVSGGDFLYWHSDPKKIFRCGKPDCAAPTLAAALLEQSPDRSFSGLAADERAVYFGIARTGGGGSSYLLHRCAHGASCEGVSHFHGDQGILQALAVDDASVAWKSGHLGTDGGRFIQSCASSAPCDGGVRTTQVADSTATLVEQSSFALSTPNAFWAEGNTVGRARIDGVDDVIILASASSPTQLLARGGYVYYLELASEGGTTGSLRRCLGTSRCKGPELVASDIALPAMLTSDESALYWTADVPGGLQLFRWKLTRPLGEVERIAIAEGSPIALTSDRAGLYWAATVDGGAAIYRFVK